MYQTGGTIKETLDEIRNRRFVLPAIQREFVWKPEQICRFYDSLMQGYPFGTFLYWRVEPENVSQYQFYEFMLKYHEKKQRLCDRLENPPDGPLTAVLDGQQRLTALNIGLRGSMAWKLPRRWWSKASAFPERRLHLDLLSGGEADENGAKYRFEFLRTDQPPRSAGRCWYPVADILDVDGAVALFRWVNRQQNLDSDQRDRAAEVADRLFKVVHSDHVIAHYEEKEQDLEKVLNIFIRMNSGGTVLSYSDLLLSVAVAQWKERNARDEINNLVDEMNDIRNGFGFNKDLVLKAGLMLSDADVRFKVRNFSKANMLHVEELWDGIREALLLSVRLLSSFGFGGRHNLTAHNALLPIAYYLHRRELAENWLGARSSAEDREAIRQWLLRSLLKTGIWSSGQDNLLSVLRRTILEHGDAAFPLDALQEEMARRGRSITFADEEMDDLADMAYGNRRLFSLLSILFPFVDTRDSRFDIDHIFPTTSFTPRRLEQAGIVGEEADEARDRMNRLGNLQLLSGQSNMEKRDRMPLEWIEAAYPDEATRNRHAADHLLGELSNSVADFSAFYETRRKALRERIALRLGQARESTGATRGAPPPERM